MPARVAFRVDASLAMGTGHVMRCLTLADSLKEAGVASRFICRTLPGHLMAGIRARGHVVHALPPESVDGAAHADDMPASSQLAHSAWLGVTQAQDAWETEASLSQMNPDWLIVDHYALDQAWEARLRPHCGRLMVIDDLADRAHHCDLLLDQTHGRDPLAYQSYVPPGCVLLCGSEFALLRPEFGILRAQSLQRRQLLPLGQILVTMGGVDQANATEQVLRALAQTRWVDGCRVLVVMGGTAPWVNQIRTLAKEMPFPCEVRTDVADMGQVMADSDLAIGAAGATSWERCCLGLPALMVVLADNQRLVAKSLETAGAACVLEGVAQIQTHLAPLMHRLMSSPALRARMSAAASRITDGCGASRVLDRLEVV